MRLDNILEGILNSKIETCGHKMDLFTDAEFTMGDEKKGSSKYSSLPYAKQFIDLFIVNQGSSYKGLNKFKLLNNKTSLDNTYGIAINSYIQQIHLFI